MTYDAPRDEIRHLRRTRNCIRNVANQDQWNCVVFGTWRDVVSECVCVRVCACVCVCVRVCVNRSGFHAIYHVGF
jgi:hypothetical protein